MAAHGDGGGGHGDLLEAGGGSTSTRTQNTEHDRLQSVNYRTDPRFPIDVPDPVIGCRSGVTCHHTRPAQPKPAPSNT
jgi:hypothetical protein